MPVSAREVGSLAASNIMTLCANHHHREVHYGNVSISVHKSAFTVAINGKALTIPRCLAPAKAA
jgi:hypothetical protein